MDRGYAIIYVIQRGNDRSLCNFGAGEASRFDFFGSQSMAGNVDHVVDAAENAVVAIRGEHSAVRCVIRPVAPILALRILVVLLVVLIDDSLRAAPDGLHNPGPRVAYANISSGAGACAHFLSFFIPNNRIDAERGRSGAAGLHGIQRGLSGAKEASRFGLPPSIDDHRFLFAYHVVIPSPDWRRCDAGNPWVCRLCRLYTSGRAELPHPAKQARRRDCDSPLELHRQKSRGP